MRIPWSLLLLPALILAAPGTAGAFADRAAPAGAPAGDSLPGDTVLAEVNGRPLRLDAYRREASSLEWTHLKGRLSRTVWRMRVLERMVENEAVLIEAERDGSLRDPKLVRMRALLPELLLGGAYLEREVFPRLAVTAGEVKAKLPEGGDAVEFDLLRFPDREEAERARPRALAGESFDGLAAAGIGERRGWSRTGLVTRGSGQFDRQTEEQLFLLPENGVSEPFVGHDGAVYLARLLRRQAGTAELDQRRAEAQATTLLTDKRERAARELRADLFREDKVEILYEGIQTAAGAGCADFDAPCAKREVAADFERRYTFADLLAFNEMLVSLKRAESDLPSTPWIALANELLHTKAVVRRARAKGLEKDPAVRAAIEDEERKLIFLHLRGRVLRGVEVGEKEISALYERNRQRYRLPEIRRARLIAVATEKEAEEIAGLLRGGADFAELAKRRSVDPSRKRGGDLGPLTRSAAGSHPPGVVELVFSLAKGEISRPYKAGGKYHLLLVEKIDPPHQSTLEEMRETLRKTLHDEKAQAALDRYIANARGKVKVKLHEDRLAQVEL